MEGGTVCLWVCGSEEHTYLIINVLYMVRYLPEHSKTGNTEIASFQ